MKLFVVVMVTLGWVTAVGQAPPAVDMDNGVLHARLYLPDTAVGYYRGTRFDWSGVMPELEYKGHRFITQWFARYVPTMHDAIMGPVESFTPLDYGSGDRFVMIGVGRLMRKDTSRYSPFKYYPIADAGKWTIQRSRRMVAFRQVLDGEYVYTKKVELVKGKPELLLIHTLKNTGSKVIESDVYDHNFFRIDSSRTGPGNVLTMGDTVVTMRKLEGHESIYGLVQHLGDYDIRIENEQAGIRIQCDRPLVKMAYWASPTISCPEPFIHIRVDPGQIFRWTIRYEFYTK